MSLPIHTCPGCAGDLRAPGAFCAGLALCLVCGADLGDELVIVTAEPGPTQVRLAPTDGELAPSTLALLHRDPGPSLLAQYQAARFTMPRPFVQADDPLPGFPGSSRYVTRSRP